MTSAGVVFDAGPLITFHKTETLWLLDALFARILVPPAVAHEVQPSLGQVRPLMQAMVASGHYASVRLQEVILEQAGEA